MTNEERRGNERLKLGQETHLAVEQGKAVPVVLDDISKSGAKFRANANNGSLKLHKNYVVRVKASDRDILFGVQLMWSQKSESGEIFYGGEFIGSKTLSQAVMHDLVQNLATAS